MARLWAFILLGSSLLFGQRPGPAGLFPWWDTPIARDLNLTAEQQGQVKSILEDDRSRFSALRAQSEKAEAELQAVLNGDFRNEKAASEAIERVVQSRAALTRSFAQLSVRLRAVLTNDQWTELQRRRTEHEQRFRSGKGRPRGGKDPGKEH